MSSQLLHVVGAALIDRSRCLVARRSVRMTSPLLWEFPGGKVESGETQRQALTRELAEELQIAVEVGAFIGRGTAQAGPRELVLDVYAATIVRGTPMAVEHETLRWCDCHELTELDWAEPDVPIVPLVRTLLSDAR